MNPMTCFIQKTVKILTLKVPKTRSPSVSLVLTIAIPHPSTTATVCWDQKMSSGQMLAHSDRFLFLTCQRGTTRLRYRAAASLARSMGRQQAFHSLCFLPGGIHTRHIYFIFSWLVA